MRSATTLSRRESSRRPSPNWSATTTAEQSVLIELVRRAAERSPEVPVVISAERSESYGECLRRSEAVAPGLAARGIERFGCAVADPQDIVVALVASSAIGCEA